MKATKQLLLSCSICAVLLCAVPASAAVREVPVPVRTVTPQYPPELRTQKISGLVMVKCVVDEHGNVAETNVVKSSNGGFDANAVEAIKRWKFKPATEDGKPISVSVTIPVKFDADDAA
jgi:protein TonB